MTPTGWCASVTCADTRSACFFIDEVAHYWEYDADGRFQNGLFARMFEEEYRDVVSATRGGPGEEEYMAYLEAIAPDSTHAGYFSVDRRSRSEERRVGKECRSRWSPYH